MKFLENLIERLVGRSPDELESEPEEQSRWIVDIPPRDGIRLGTFRTKQEALDYRREYIIRSIRDVDPIELPF